MQLINRNKPMKIIILADTFFKIVIRHTLRNFKERKERYKRRTTKEYLDLKNRSKMQKNKNAKNKRT